MAKQMTKDQEALLWKAHSTYWGLRAVGFAIGGTTALMLKRGIWGTIGFAVLGSILGHGAALVINRNAIDNTNDDEGNEQDQG